MRRAAIIFILLSTVCIAHCQIFKDAKWGSEFGAALVKSGGSAGDVTRITNLIKELYTLENNGQYHTAGQLGYGLYRELNQRGGPVLRTKIYANLLDHLSRDFNEIGWTSVALYFGLEAESSWAKIVKTSDVEYVNSVVNLAVYYMTARDIDESEKWIEKGLSITAGNSKLQGYYNELLNTKACMYDHVGRCADAARLEEQIVEGNKKAKLLWIENLAHFRYRCGETDKALGDMQNLLALYRENGQDKSNAYAAVLQKVASYYRASGNIDKAIELIQQAIDIFKSNSTTLNAKYALCLSSLAAYKSDLGHYDEAIALEKRAQKILSKISSYNTPQLLNSLETISKYQYKTGDWQDAGLNMIACTKALDDNIRYSMMQVGENRQRIWNTYRKWYMATIPMFTYRIGSDSLQTLAYDATLLSKGLLLNTEITLLRLADESPTVKTLYEEWQTAKTERDKPNTPDEYNRLAALAEEKEKAFMRECRLAGSEYERLSVKWTDVKEKLGDNDVAVEFLQFPVENDTTIYAALVLNSKMALPKFLPLAKFSKGQTIRSLDEKNLSRALWGKLEPYMARNVYFSPAADLYNMAIESLPDWRNENKIVSESWNFYRLSSTRELVLSRKGFAKQRAAVYGGLIYDTSIDDMVAEAAQYSENRKREGVMSLDYLPGTKTEALNIVNTIRNTAEDKISVSDYIGSQGTEASFKSLSGEKCKIIHVATHGFYLTQEEADESEFLDENASESSVEDKALARSGLFFAGADNKCGGEVIPEGVDDGVLTAKEISTLDFSGLDLIALSACETAKGDISGDGVFGLQRGFKKAGANSILMSLWKVDDDATSLLMTEFYKNWISGQSKHDAFNAAKDAVRRIDRYSSPKCWAAFILLDAIE